MRVASSYPDWGLWRADGGRRARNAVFCATIMTLLPLPNQARACELASGAKHTVVAVLDAETVRIETGQEVRLTGVLAPHRSDVPGSGAWPPEEAAKAATTALLMGRGVKLKFDALRQDRNGRILAHVFLDQAGPDVENWVQARLLADGWARVAPTRDNPSCGQQLAAFEQKARTENKGQWANAAYVGVDARFMGRLARAHGTFQIVRGNVGDVRQRSEFVEIELSKVPGRRTVLRIRRDDRTLLGTLEGDPRRLQGQPIEARGWIMREQGASGLRRDIVVDATAMGHVARLPDSGEPNARERPVDKAASGGD